jgi:hypothetical protein
MLLFNSQMSSIRLRVEILVSVLTAVIRGGILETKWITRMLTLLMD